MVEVVGVVGRGERKRRKGRGVRWVGKGKGGGRGLWVSFLWDTRGRWERRGLAWEERGTEGGWGAGGGREDGVKEKKEKRPTLTRHQDRSIEVELELADSHLRRRSFGVWTEEGDGCWG